MMNKIYAYLSIIGILFLFTTPCKLADIRTNEAKAFLESPDKKGERLLDAAHRAMGIDQLTTYETYTLEYEEQYYGLGKWINKFNANSLEK